MASPTDYFVNPAIAGDSGTGTIGDPYGDIQFALDSITRDTTDGDRLSIKSGTDEILAAALDLTTYGTPVEDAPLQFRGYTTALEDGGTGGINGNSFTIISPATLNHIIFVDMHLHNSGANDVINLNDFCAFVNCEVDNGAKGISIDNNGVIVNCYVHNCSSRGIEVGTCAVMFNYLTNGASDFTEAIRSNGAKCYFNVIDISGASIGIAAISAGPQPITAYNSIYSVSGTGTGIREVSDNRGLNISNIIEGFSGIGGIGISAESSSNLTIYGFNSFFNNTTNLSKNGDIVVDLSANDQALTESAFLDAANKDFRVNSLVKALAYPTANFPNLSVRTYLDIGALQRLEGFPTTFVGAGGEEARIFNVPAEDRIYRVGQPV